jgi:phosphopantothenoylcysteine decarboxylase/phosphopantothenate--cysteine ligase
LGAQGYHSVVHLAAVSDYSVDSIEINGMKYAAPYPDKLDSSAGEMIIHLKRNKKILDHIKAFSAVSEPFLVAFKYTSGTEENIARQKIFDIKESSRADIIVWNDTVDRINNIQTGFAIYSEEHDLPEKCADQEKLAERLESIVAEHLNK